MEYIINPAVKHINVNNEAILTLDELTAAISFCNQAIKKLNSVTQDLDVNVFDLLGMRNLSSFVGEFFASSIEKCSNNKLVRNLHQDGYPDLLLHNTEARRAYYSSAFSLINGRKCARSKNIFSPYREGGIEVKATCGSTPSALIKPKLLIGEQRIGLMTKFDWKAHHRETNNLLAILWDFINEVPAVTACFYRNDLNVNDWGKIVQPKEGGGRTTSVSIMTAAGVKKMCSGWLAVIKDEKYTHALANKKWIGANIMPL